MSAEGIGHWDPAASDVFTLRTLTISGSRTVQMPTTVEELCLEFDEVCRSAVDPLEIASALEFEGIGDRTARGLFGFPDVFALAEEMYQRVARRPEGQEPPPGPWQSIRSHPVLHGLLYGLPAACYPAAAGLLTGAGVVTTLVVALLAAWAVSQGVASLGYQRLGRGDLAAVKGVLRSGLAGGLAVAGLAMTVTAFLARPGIPVLVFGAGEGAYMLGAGVLLVLGAERWLLAALAPGVLAGALFLLLGRPPGAQYPIWALLAATPVLAVVLAVVHSSPGRPPARPLPTAAELRAFRLTRARVREAIPTAGQLRAALRAPARVRVAIPTAAQLRAALPAAVELRTALPFAAFGLVSAGLLAFPVAAGPDGHGGINIGALIAAVPLSLSMGAAEWSLLWYRRRTQRVLRVVSTPQRFAAKARPVLLLALGRYLAGALVLTAAAVGAAAWLIHPPWAAAAEAGIYLALGAAMFLMLLLQTFRLLAVPFTAAAAALAAEVAFRGHGMAAQAAATAALLAVVAIYATLTLSRAAHHAV
jgi:hypothetical protein